MKFFKTMLLVLCCVFIFTATALAIDIHDVDCPCGCGMQAIECLCGGAVEALHEAGFTDEEIKAFLNTQNV
jgi:hypothetical protein